MDESELIDGSYYYISIFEDTDSGFTERIAKILEHADGRDRMFGYRRAYFVEDIDGATSWITHQSFERPVLDENIKGNYHE